MKPSCATDTHWIGGVKHPRGEMLNGWPCCCSGRLVRRIMASGAPLTYRIALVTCGRCLRVMRKSAELSAALDEVTRTTTKGPRTWDEK